MAMAGFLAKESTDASHTAGHPPDGAGRGVNNQPKTRAEAKPSSGGQSPCFWNTMGS
jgi:hypothetical protein